MKWMSGSTKWQRDRALALARRGAEPHHVAEEVRAPDDVDVTAVRLAQALIRSSL